MAKDSSLFYSLSGSLEENIYDVYGYTLNITGNGDVECQHRRISGVYHVPSMSANLLSISQLTKTNKTIEFWSDRFIMKDIRCGGETISFGILDPK